MNLYKYLRNILKNERAWILPVLLLIFGFSIGAFGIGMMFGDDVQRYYYRTNPPIYNPPQEKTSIISTQLLSLLNEKRQKRNLKLLKENKMLDYIAYIRAKTILDTQDFSHEATQSGLPYTKVATNLGYFYEGLGENLAMGFTNKEKILKAWEKSKEHADIMFSNDYTEAGSYTLEGNFYGYISNITVLIMGKQ